MNSEELLKSISATLNKHKDFLNSNPEMFKAIEYRLFKAIDDEHEDEGYEGEYTIDPGGELLKKFRRGYK